MKTVVECSNCGGGGSNIQFWIALVGLAIAVAALGMNYRQFRHFRNEIRARAEFKVTVKVCECDEDGILRTTDDTCLLRVAMWVKNTGRRAAGETVVNVIVPRTATEVRWCGPNGEEMDEGGIVALTDEVVEDPDGTTHPGQYLSLTLPGLGTKPNSLSHFKFRITISERKKIVVPIRTVVVADEIPDDIDAYVKNWYAEAERVDLGGE